MRWRRERGGFVPPHWGVNWCVEEKNEAAIYRRIERKKKTMQEIKKEREEKWNVSGRKEMVSGMVEMKSYGNEPFI